MWAGELVSLVLDLVQKVLETVVLVLVSSLVDPPISGANILEPIVGMVDMVAGLAKSS